MTGYIHTVYPRQTVSFKMGSPLKTVGVINADVSTCIAGWLGRKADMLPVRMTVSATARTSTPRPSTSRSSGSARCCRRWCSRRWSTRVDMEGELPEEMTADFDAPHRDRGPRPIIHQGHLLGLLRRTGAVGAVRPDRRVVSSPDVQLVQAGARSSRSSASTRIRPGAADRRDRGGASWTSSDIRARATRSRRRSILRPYKGQRQRVKLSSLKLPADLPEGSTSRPVGRRPDRRPARRCATTRRLCNPQNSSRYLRRSEVQTTSKRHQPGAAGAGRAAASSLDGKALPNLPPSMVQCSATAAAPAAQTMGSALVAATRPSGSSRAPESVKFRRARRTKKC